MSFLSNLFVNISNKFPAPFTSDWLSTCGKRNKFEEATVSLEIIWKNSIRNWRIEPKLWDISQLCYILYYILHQKKHLGAIIGKFNLTWLKKLTSIPPFYLIMVLTYQVYRILTGLAQSGQLASLVLKWKLRSIKLICLFPNIGFCWRNNSY